MVSAAAARDRRAGPSDGPAGGSRPLIVLLHGAFLNAAVWHGYAGLLGDEFRVIAPEYPPDVPCTDGRFSLSATVDAIARDIERCGGHALVVGHSLGGYVGLALASTRPELVDGLVLIGASTPPRGFGTLLLPHLALLERLASRVSAPGLGMLLERRAPGHWPRLQAAGLLVARGAAAVRSLRRFDYWRAVRAVRCPILVVNGERDWLFRVFELATRSAAADARLAIVPRAGHLLPLTRPSDVARLIRRFAAQLGAG